MRKIPLVFAEGLEKVSGPSALYMRQSPFRAEGPHNKNRPSAPGGEDFYIIGKGELSLSPKPKVESDYLIGTVRPRLPGVLDSEHRINPTQKIPLFI